MDGFDLPLIINLLELIGCYVAGIKNNLRWPSGRVEDWAINALQPNIFAMSINAPKFTAEIFTARECVPKTSIFRARRLIFAEKTAMLFSNNIRWLIVEYIKE